MDALLEIRDIFALNFKRYRAAARLLRCVDGAGARFQIVCETLRLCPPWRRTPRASAPGFLRVKLKPLGGRLVRCRRSYADLGVLYDTFCGAYHLPPPELHPVRTILDLGSNIGLTMAHLAVLYPQARILGVELDRENWEMACWNVACFGERCRVIHAAVWWEPGEVLYGGQWESGYRVVSGEWGQPKGKVRSVTVDELIDLLGVPVVDYVKMDIEGAETELLPRRQAWLQRVRCLKVELHPHKALKPYTLEQAAEDLRASGFRVHRDLGHPRCLVAMR